MIAVFLRRRDLDTERLTVYLQESTENCQVFESHLSSERTLTMAEARLLFEGKNVAGCKSLGRLKTIWNS